MSAQHDAQDADKLRDTIHKLREQVQTLEKEVGDAHTSDYNTLRRAYVSLVQHFRALQVEAQVMKAHINALDVDVMGPDDVSKELTAVAAVVGIAALAGRLLRQPRFAGLRLGFWSIGGVYLGLRFVSAGFSRMGSLLVRNRQRKQRLQQDWLALTERIRIMDDLTRWEGQNPSLQPPATLSPARSQESAGASSGWFDVGGADEAEGRVSYPSPYSAAALDAVGVEEDTEEGIVGYPQVHGQHASEGEGAVSYPSLTEAQQSAKKQAQKQQQKGDGSELPSAPPLPKREEESKIGVAAV